MTYPQAIQYLESFVNYEKIPPYPYKESLKLGRIRDFLGIIGRPQDSLRCLHIAGTKGKGSTCAFIAYILKEAGYKVGLYTSPHLLDFRERIRILGHQVTRSSGHQINKDFEGAISKKKLTHLLETLKPDIEKYNKISKYGALTFFEIYTTLAFVYFKEQKVDLAILETGLGGRLDATNVVNSCVCAITPLSYEHTQTLGSSLRQIAAEKAGIIKSHQVTKSPSHQSVVITAPQENEAIEVIRKKCKEKSARLYEVGKDITFQKTNNGFNVKGIFGKYPDLKTKLLGEHQLVNVSVAIGVIELLRAYNINVATDSIRGGLYNTVWPGRCEVISKNPLVVLDGAQNIASARALKETIKNNFRYKRLILILGISQDKDIKGICDELGGLADEIVLTRANNPRAASPDTLADYFNGKKAHITNCVGAARAKARDIARKQDLILVSGSLFVVGEFRNDKIRYK